MINTFFIVVAGLLLPVLTYFAGVQRTKQRYEQDDSEQRITKVVDEYQKLWQPRTNAGLPALLEAGIALLKNNKEAREACRRLQIRNDRSPLESSDKELADIDLHRFFLAIREHKLNPQHPDCIRLAKEKM